MKHYLFCFFLFTQLFYAQVNNDLYRSGMISSSLSKKELSTLKDYLQLNYSKNLDSLKTITIFYYQPKENCSYDRYSGSNKIDVAGIKKLRDNIKSSVMFLNYEKGYENWLRLYDVNGLIYKLFFKSHPECDGMVTFNDKGEYRIRAGHSSLEIANYYIDDLNK